MYEYKNQAKAPKTIISIAIPTYGQYFCSELVGGGEVATSGVLAEAVKVAGAESFSPWSFVVFTEWTPAESEVMRKTLVRSPGPIVTDEGLMVAAGETAGVTTTLAIKSAP